MPAEPANAETRERILCAACDIFAEHGFHKATVRSICDRAGANVAAINYYFRDKENLYTEVLKYSYERSVAKYPLEMGAAPNATPEERLYAFIHSFLLRVYDTGEGAWYGKLITREMVEPTPALDQLLGTSIMPLYLTLRDILQLNAQGAATDAELRRFGCSVVGQIVFYHHCRPALARVIPDAYCASEVEPIARHITDLTLAGLERIRRRTGKPEHGHAGKERKAP